MSSARLLPGVFLAGMIAFSCGPGTAPTIESPDRLPVERLLARTRNAEAGVHTLSGRGTMSFESPEQSGTAFFSVTIRKPDSLLVVLEGPFGIDLGLLAVTSRSYTLYNSIDNTVLSGAPDGRSLRSVLPLHLTVPQVVSAFAGSFPIPDTQPVDYRIDGDRYLVAFVNGSDSSFFWIDPATSLVVRYEMRGEHGIALAEAVSSMFTEQDDAIAPRHIVLSFPSQERSVSVHYTSISLNPDEVSFVYSVPASARRLARTP